MSLMRLLTAGKSLTGLKQLPGRYKISDPRSMPKFRSTVNPFKSKTAKTEPLAVQKFAQQRLAAPLEHSRIIVIGSAAGEVAGNGTDIAYGSSKAAIFGLIRQAAFDLASANITVNSVAPGPVGTPEFFRNTNEQIRAGIASLTALKRLATPEEVSAGVAYIASREAAYITGSTLAINGGVHMH